MTRKEYQTRFEKERSYFKHAKGTDTAGREFTWPYNPTVSELKYKRWLENVVDPATKEYNIGTQEYFESNDDGTESLKTKKFTEPIETVLAIYRIRYHDKEYLLSKGRITGFSQFGQIVPSGDNKTIYSYGGDESYPEMYYETKFSYQMGMNRNNRITNQLESSGERIPHYLLTATKEHIEELWAKRDPEEPCILAVKDAINGTVKQCPNIEMFKTLVHTVTINEPCDKCLGIGTIDEKPCIECKGAGKIKRTEIESTFDYIKDMGYLSEKDRAERLQEYETIQQNTISPRKKA
jgi:hypothetical protein